MRVIGLATVALALVGCFPDYQVGADGSGGEGGFQSVRRDRKGGAYISAADDARLRSDEVETEFAAADYYADAGFRCAATAQAAETRPYMSLIAAKNTGHSYQSNQTAYSVKFSRDFLIDQFEVSVKRYRDWLDSGQPMPCDSGTCSLDPGGPYESQMVWDAEWNAVASQANYKAQNPGLSDCYTPKPYNATGIVAEQSLLVTTWELGQEQANQDFPMTCVSWFQAAAFCAWDKKRLPTEAEWVFAATSRGQQSPYPWGTQTPSCSLAVIDTCTFPTNVGTVTAGQTDDGINDMAGNVFEWVWDRPWTEYPSGAGDWAGPP